MKIDGKDVALNDNGRVIGKVVITGSVEKGFSASVSVDGRDIQATGDCIADAARELEYKARNVFGNPNLSVGFEENH